MTVIFSNQTNMTLRIADKGQRDIYLCRRNNLSDWLLLQKISRNNLPIFLICILNSHTL